MARHIYIHLHRTQDAPAPAPAKKAKPKHDPTALVAALMEAIAARQGKTGDAGFDESKVKRDEGGRFSAQQHAAAAKEHNQAHSDHTDKANASSGAERQRHLAASSAHASAANYHQEAWRHLSGNPMASGNREEHIARAHHYSQKAVEASKALSPQGKRAELDNLVSNLAETEDPVARKRDGARAAELKKELDGPAKAPAASSAATSAPSTGKPTKATASGAKAATHELLSSGHPFTVDELMKATGCSNKTTLMTAISDLKSPKYAGKLGALSIKKNADGTFQIEKKAEGSTPKFPMSAHGEAKGTMHMGPGDPNAKLPAHFGANANVPPAPPGSYGSKAEAPMSGPSGPLPLRKAPNGGGDVTPAQNIQARIDMKKTAGGKSLQSVLNDPQGKREVNSIEEMAQALERNPDDRIMRDMLESAQSDFQKKWGMSYGPERENTQRAPAGMPNTAGLVSGQTSSAKPATPAQLTAAKNKIGSIEMQIENLVRKGAGRSDGRLFDLRTKLAKAQNEHSRLLSTVPKK